MFRRLAAVLISVYLISFAFYYVYSLRHIDATRRIFTKKELSDGPLVMKEKVLVGKGRLGKPTGKIVAMKKIDKTPPKLTENFKKQFVQKAKEIGKKEKLVYFSLLNAAFERLTLNFLCNIAEFKNAHEKVLIVGTEPKVCNSIKEQWKISCLSMDLDGFDDSADWGSKKYIYLLNLRAELMNSLVQEDVSFLLFETDAVWLRDPTELFSNQTLVDDADIVVPVKGYNNKWDGLAFSPMLVYPTDGSKHLFNHLVDQLKADTTLYDQDVLNELCLSQYNGVVCRQFEWEEVSDGKWFKLSDSERSSLKPFIVNNNYYVGVGNKESRQALNGLWFLSKSSRCLKTKVQRALRRYDGSSTGI